ncbi:MAG: cobalamin-dependent protein, partial [Spirochaetales bacterium]
MDEAVYILSHLEDLAKAIVENLYTANKGLWDRYGQEGKQKALQDTVYHLQYLAEAIKAEEPSFFQQYTGWLKTLFTGLALPPSTLEKTLFSIVVVLEKALPKANGMAISYLNTALDYIKQAPEEPPSFLTGDSPLEKLARQFLHHLLAGEKEAAFTLIRETFQQGTSLKDLYLNVFQRTQREIGRLWQLNRISVAQEHFCTAATQQIMAFLYPYVFRGGNKTKRILIACIGKELHEIGARMVADFFELEGWDSYFIGANTPSESLLRMVQDKKPDIVGLSVTLLVHLEELYSLIPRLRTIHPGM